MNHDRLYQEALSDPELKRTGGAGGGDDEFPRSAVRWCSTRSKTSTASALDDYKPFSDVSSSLDRLVRFLSAAVVDRQQKLVKVDDATCDLVTAEGTCHARFTLSREAATHQDNLQLMGLDHPLVQEELGRWRSVPPEEVGIAVSGDVDEPILLSLWIVEASAGKGERRVVVQPIAVKQDGTRVPAVERRPAKKYLQAPQPATPIFQAEQRIDLFARAAEPTFAAREPQVL